MQSSVKKKAKLKKIEEALKNNLKKRKHFYNNQAKERKKNASTIR